jgi:hypothetical protein
MKGNFICPICELKIKKEDSVVTVHYPLKFHKGLKLTLILSGVNFHVNCRYSKFGNEFIEEARKEAE